MFKWLKGKYSGRNKTKKVKGDLDKKISETLDITLLSTEYMSLTRIVSLGKIAHHRAYNHIATLLRNSSKVEVKRISGGDERHVSNIILALTKGYTLDEIEYRLGVRKKEIDRVRSFFAREFSKKETEEKKTEGLGIKEQRLRKKGALAVRELLLDQYRFKNKGAERMNPETLFKERLSSINNSLNIILRNKRDRHKKPLEVTFDIIPIEPLSLVDVYTLVESVDYMFAVAKKFQTKDVHYTFRIHEDFAFFKGENRVDVKKRVREIENFADEFRELLKDVQGNKQKSQPKRTLGMKPEPMVLANLEVLTDRKLRREKNSRTLQTLRKYAQEEKISSSEDSTWLPVLYSEHSISAFSFIRGYEDMELKEDTPYIFSTLETTIALSQSTLEADVQISGSLDFLKEETYTELNLLEGTRIPFLYRTKTQLYGMLGEKINRLIHDDPDEEKKLSQEIRDKNNVFVKDLPRDNNLAKKLYAMISSDTFEQGFGIVDYWRLMQKETPKEGKKK